MSRALRQLLPGALIATVVFAQDDPQAATREAFKSMQKAFEDVRGANTPEDRKAKREALHAAVDKFQAAFAASDWEKWDPAADRLLLVQGLSFTGQKALEAHDGHLALRAYDTLAAKVPDVPVNMVAHTAAHAAAGGFEKALAFLEKSANTGDKKAATLLLLGDYRAAAGDVAGAQKAWEAAVAAPPADADPRRDPLTPLAKADAAMRLKYVGKDAPEIATNTWIDGEAKPLSALKGSVVLVDFWATWCPPCRQVMPGLDALYKEKKGAGLVVLGVTQFYANGFMPTQGTEDPLRDGEQVEEIKEDKFLDHVKQFKANTALSYPFAIATAAEFAAYGVRGIPTLVVVGRDGKIAFLKVGGGDETLLKVAVEKQLAAKS